MFVLCLRVTGHDNSFLVFSLLIASFCFLGIVSLSGFMLHWHHLSSLIIDILYSYMPQIGALYVCNLSSLFWFP